jgi:hypothetical protein
LLLPPIIIIRCLIGVCPISLGGVTILGHWNRYRKKFQYAKKIEFSDLEEKIINLWNAIEDNGI